MRLKSSQLRAWKAQHYTGVCDLCREPLDLAEAVADHDHKTGRMRGVLHRRCNSLEGVIARGLKRFGFTSSPSFLGLELYYAQATRFTELHPTHRTLDEKKLLAKKRRIRKKATSL